MAFKSPKGIDSMNTSNLKVNKMEAVKYLSEIVKKKLQKDSRRNMTSSTFIEDKKKTLNSLNATL